MLHFVALCGMIFGNDVDGIRKRVDTMEYAHRMTKDERERHDTLRKAGSLGVFGQRLSQDVLDQYADIVGPVDNHVTPDEAREVAEAYKNEIYKALHK